MPHTDLRHYYVTMKRGSRTAWLAGPFETHAEALAMVEIVKQLACSLDLWADFDAFGTSSIPRWPWNPNGVLNNRLGTMNKRVYNKPS